MKICTKCKIRKSKSCFGKHKNHKDGLRYACKKCRREHYKKYYQENKEKIGGQKKKYREKNKEYYIEYSKKHRTENKEHYSEYHKKYYIENKNKRMDYRKKWRKANPEKVASYKQNRRAKEAGNGGSFTEQEWKDLKKKFGNICLKCVISEDEVTLAADHVIPLSKGGGSDIKNIQPLCKSCNSSKGTKSADYR